MRRPHHICTGKTTVTARLDLHDNLIKGSLGIGAARSGVNTLRDHAEPTTPSALSARQRSTDLCASPGRGKPAQRRRLLAAQSQAPESQAAPLQFGEDIHARCEALIGSEGRLGP